MNLLPGISTSLSRRFVLLAPPSCDTSLFSATDVNACEHNKLLAQAQELRGRIYLRDGAIESWQLSAEGRHVQTEDSNSWHLLSLDETGAVGACARYLPHENTVSFSQLSVAHSALARCKQWGRSLKCAVEDELKCAQTREIPYLEMGGWAISEALRCTTEAVRMIITFYGLAQLLGGAMGITTATTRHCSSSILRRIGGRSLVAAGVELPSYYDAQYKCEMEVLRFDSSQPNSRYVQVVEDCKYYLQHVPVIRITPESRQMEHYSGVTVGVPSLRPAAAFGGVF